VASWILDNLLNVGTADRGFRAIYGISGPEGYTRRTFDFKLLEETWGGDGDLYLRATNEAVNVLVGALEVDIESAQIAADLRLDILIRRGRLTDAQAAAQAARLRTIQYGEMLRQQLEATTRDVRNVDWLEAMPQFIEEALTHIEDRCRTENAILIHITDVRDAAETPQARQQAARLVDAVRDCLRRHAQLQAALQAAGPRFRAEQDRQAFTLAQVPTVALDLHGQLLSPVLGLAAGAAARPLEVYFAQSAGLDVPPAVRMADLFDALITPPASPDLLGDELTDPQLDELTEPERFTDATYAALYRLLDLDPAAPQRLSGMLEAARAAQEQAWDSGEDVAELPLLAVLRVLAMAAQEIAAARTHQDRYVMIAVDDGTRLTDPDFCGADLLVCRAELARGAPAGAVPDEGAVVADGAAVCEGAA
jgi:hypothetical protein